MTSAGVGATRYRWLLFDADNTLFDYETAWADAFRATFDQLGVPFDAGYPARFETINHGIWRVYEAGGITSAAMRVRRFELLFEAIGASVDAGHFSAAYLRNLSMQSGLMPGALAVVAALHARHRVGIVTNGFADVQRPRLERSPIRAYVDEIVISEEVGAAKPQPAIFEAAFRRMGDPRRDEVLMIGDSLASDIAGGAGYGIDTCWYNPRAEPSNGDVAATYEIRRLDELIGLLGPAG